MTVHVKPPPKYQQEIPEDLPEVVEETPQESAVASSMRDLMPTSGRVRYRTEKIPGLAKPVRFRSLTARQVLDIREKEGEALLLEVLKWTICDSEGRQYLNDEDLQVLRSDDYDGRTLQSLIRVAEEHTFATGDLDDLIEDAGKNSPETEPESTS